MTAISDLAAIGKAVTACEELAKAYSDGHITIMRFTTGWKVMFSTPDLSFEGRKSVGDIKPKDTLIEALTSAARRDL